MKNIYPHITQILCALLLTGACSYQIEYKDLIERGEFSRAENIIRQELADSSRLTGSARTELMFELERMQRIRRDFTETEKQVTDYIRQYIPDVAATDLRRWEAERSLEYMLIDGQKMYFSRAARNLFRINKACREIWNKQHAEPENPDDPARFDLDNHILDIMHFCKETGDRYTDPVRLRIDYSIRVHGAVVPEGETIRCWIPFPREISGRQVNIRLLNSEPETYRLADNANLQRTIFFEQPSRGRQPTIFRVVYEYTSQGGFVDIDPDLVEPLTQQDGLQEYLREEAPHILFTDSLKALSKRITGGETNPYRIAQKLFAWVDENIPWASAREYSTIRNLSMYPFIHRHGDCGIQTMLFITLCRLNGIPARWQSGWEFQPPDDSMHDWGMIYFKPYGWVPMDVTYGQRQSDDEKFRFFYLNGMDSYRLIFNDGFSREFDPPKKHLRSETVDSQRGEVEWSGGNLYFDQWDWDMKWQVVSD